MTNVKLLLPERFLKQMTRTSFFVPYNKFLIEREIEYVVSALMTYCLKLYEILL